MMDDRLRTETISSWLGDGALTAWPQCPQALRVWLPRWARHGQRPQSGSGQTAPVRQCKFWHAQLGHVCSGTLSWGMCVLARSAGACVFWHAQLGHVCSGRLSWGMCVAISTGFNSSRAASREVCALAVQQVEQLSNTARAHTWRAGFTNTPCVAAASK